MNVLIAEPMSQAGIELFQAQQGWNIIVSNPKDYAKHLPECDALVVRSAVQVTPDVLKQAPKLRVIGRAGVGVDNVNLPAATAAGVLVMNTPGGNAVSVAEHTIALMLSMARSIPQASASTKAGKWEKKKFLGSELRGKTIGVIGLGSIGREVVRRARAFEMNVIATDPYVTSQIAKDLGLNLVKLPELYAKSDYITVHVSLTPETDKLLNKEAFAQMKKGVRIVNCARGELLDELALKEAIESGKVAGASLDVFTKEPTDASFPLFSLESVLATPHIGGSTEEAQEIVGVRIAEQMVEYLQNGGRDQRGEHAGVVSRAVQECRPVHRFGRASWEFRGSPRDREPDHGPHDLLRPHRRHEYESAAQRRSGWRSEPFHRAGEGQRGECHATGFGSRLECS